VFDVVKMVTKSCIAIETVDNIIQSCGQSVISSSRDGNYCSDHAHQYRLEKPDDCSVCLNPISEDLESPLMCGHWTCINCLKASQKLECPVCRSKMTNTEVIRVTDSEIILKASKRLISYLQSLIDTTKHAIDSSDLSSLVTLIDNIAPIHDMIMNSTLIIKNPAIYTTGDKLLKIIISDLFNLAANKIHMNS
jgi:hypothetical protein